MISIIGNVAVAVAKEAVKLAVISGGVLAAARFTTRRIKRVKAGARVEANNIATDFVDGNIALAKDFPLTTAGMLATAGAVVVNPVAGAVAVSVTAGFATFELGRIVYKELRSAFPELRIFNLKRKKSDALWEDAADKLNEAKPKKPKLMKFDAKLDAELLQGYTGAQARAYGYSWYEENVAPKKERPSFEDLKRELMTALMKIQIPSNKRIMFVRGVEDAWAHTA